VIQIFKFKYNILENYDNFLKMKRNQGGKTHNLMNQDKVRGKLLFVD